MSKFIRRKVTLAEVRRRDGRAQNLGDQRIIRRKLQKSRCQTVTVWTGGAEGLGRKGGIPGDVWKVFSCETWLSIKCGEQGRVRSRECCPDFWLGQPGRWWHGSMILGLWERPRFQGVTPSVEFSLGHVLLEEAMGSQGGGFHLTLNPSSFLSAWLPHPPDTDQTLEWWGEGALGDL